MPDAQLAMYYLYFAIIKLLTDSSRKRSEITRNFHTRLDNFKVNFSEITALIFQ